MNKAYAASSCFLTKEDEQEIYIEQPKKYEYKGKMYSLVELFELPECKASVPLLFHRLEKKHWNVENALAVEYRPRPSAVKKGIYLYDYNGKQYKLSELFDMLDCKVSFATFSNRIRKCGWDIERAAATPVMSLGDCARLAGQSRRKPR
jgi:hypothetical protein